MVHPPSHKDYGLNSLAERHILGFATIPGGDDALSGLTAFGKPRHNRLVYLAVEDVSIEYALESVLSDVPQLPGSRQEYDANNWF